MEKVITLDAEVVADTKLVIEGAAEVKIDTSKSITAEIAPDTYVLGSVGSFDTASSWVGAYVNELVRESIGTGGTLADALLNIRDYVMDEIALGVNQVITQIENEYVSNSTLTTTLASELGPSRAAILDIQTTYATQTEAQAYSIDAIKASFGGNSGSASVEAYIGSIALAHVDATGAWAATTDVLTTVYNDISVELTDTREIAIGEFTEWDGNGTPMLGMFKYEGGVWYQYRGGTLGIYGDGWVVTPVSAALAASSAVNNELETFADATNNSITNLQSQVDGSISTWFYNIGDGNVPTLEIIPASDWVTIDTANGDDLSKIAHIGDLFYNKDDGKAYRFAYEDIVGDTPDEGVIFSWILVTDVDISKALADAAKAQDTADGKRIVFYDDAVPSNIIGINGYVVAISNGDLWIPSQNVVVGIYTYVKGEVYAYVSGATPREWVLATRYTEAITAVSQEFTTWQNGEYDSFVTAITTQTDRKSESYYQDAPDPSTTWDRADDINHVGDLWKTPGDGNKEYVWQLDGTYKWVEMNVPDIVFDTIDKKKAIYTGTTNPWDDINNDVKDNDMWITANGTLGYDDEQVYVWSDSQSMWVKPLTYATGAELILLETGLGNGTVAINLSTATVDGVKTLTDYVAEEIDKEVVVYSGTNHTIQTGMKVNDIYIEKTVDSSGAVPVDVVNTYKYNGTTWTTIGNNTNLTALADLADGKRTIYRGTTTPEAQGYTPEIRDVWIPETGVVGYDANEMYVYDGAWNKATKYTDDTKAQNIIDGIEQVDLSEHVNSLGWQTASEVSTTASSTLNTWITATYDIDQLATQTALDGKIESYFMATAPYLDGTNDATKDGDLWYNTSTKYLYRYVYSTLSWTGIEDQTAIDAASAAATAQSTADGKIVTFLQATEPTAEGVGDIWIDTDDNNKMYRYNGVTWDYFRDDTALDAFLTVTYADDLSGIYTQIDGKSVSYFQATEPFAASAGTAAQDGDVWYNSTTKELKVFTYDSVTPTWNLVIDPKAVEAYDNAATAQATADGKIQNFTSEPTHPYYQGDTWMQGITGEIYVCQTDSVTAFNMNDWVRASSYTDNTAANRNKQVFRLPLATPPASPEEGDLWFVTDYYYTGVTGTTSSTTKSEYGILTKEYINGAWVNVAVEDRGNYAGISWAGYASSLLTGPNGEITGWQYSDGGVIGGNSTSEFKISADKFKVTGSEGTANWADSFSIVAGSPNKIKFDGVVDFTNSDMSAYDNTNVDLSGLATDTLSNVTTIDGGKITTGTIDASVVNVTNIDASNIKADTIWVNGNVKSSNYSWNGSESSLPTGFGLFANGDVNGYNIVGGKMYGGEIIGARILLRNEAGMLAYPAFTVTVGSVPVEIINAQNAMIDFKYDLYAYNHSDSTKFNRFNAPQVAPYHTITSGVKYGTIAVQEYTSDYYTVDFFVVEEVWVGTVRKSRVTSDAYLVGVPDSALTITTAFSSSLFNYRVDIENLGYAAPTIAKITPTYYNTNGLSLSGDGKITARVLICYLNSTTGYTYSDANPPTQTWVDAGYSKVHSTIVVGNQAINMNM